MNHATMWLYIYLWSAVWLLCTSILTTMRLFSPQLTPFEEGALLCSTVCTMIASLHYGVMSIADDREVRRVLKYTDWCLTVPVMRLQICAVVQFTDIFVIRRMLLYCMLMLLSGLIGEMSPNTTVKVGMGFISYLWSEESVHILEESKPIIRHHVLHKLNRNVFYIYTVYYVIGILPDGDPWMCFLEAITDTFVKSAMGMYLMIQSKRTHCV